MPLLKHIQRFIDQAISRSMLRQLSFLLVSTLLAFGALLLTIFLTYGNLKLHIMDWIYSYINPGSFFSAQGKELTDRVWALLVGIFGLIFLNGLLISVISNIIERRVEKVKNGKAYYYFNNHIVIIGYSPICVGLIGRFAQNKKYQRQQIVLLTTREVPKVRHELFGGLESKVEKRITLISGSRTSSEDLARLQINRCIEVFILSDIDVYDNDSLNVEALQKIDHLLSNKPIGKLIRCNVLFEHPSTFALFQRQDLSHLKNTIDFVPFNFNEMWAQRVLTGSEYLPLDREGISAESNKKVHLVVVGISEMGITLAIQAAQLCHFPNFVTQGIKTKITFIDPKADKKRDSFMARYRHLVELVEVHYYETDSMNTMNKSLIDNGVSENKASFTDIEFEFIRANVESPAIQEYIAKLSGDPNLFLTIAICFSSPPQSIAAGLYLPNQVYDNNIPVWVRQEIPHNALHILTQKGKFQNVISFGMLENCYDLAKADDLIPMMINYVYQKGVPLDFPKEEMALLWQHLSTAHKWSNRYNADSIKVKMRSFPAIFSGSEWSHEHLELMAQVEHNRWNMEKLLMGYRATTPLEKEAIAKDPSLKNKLKTNHFAHNDLCAYHDLQRDESGIDVREYDRLILKALPRIMKSAHFSQSIKV